MVGFSVPILPGGVWVPNLTRKQFEIFNCYDRFTLVSGPRKSSKTYGCSQRMVRHAWETDRAKIGILCKQIKSGLEGIWDVLWNIILPEWVQNMDGFEITKRPSTHAVTRMPYMRVRNSWGTESEFQIHSLDSDTVIEQKMKATVFSMIFVSELTNFKTKKIFEISKEQLRCPHLTYEQHMWLSDTNPDEDDGEQFWAYKIWYEDRIAEDYEYPSFQRELRLIESTIDDNTFLDPREVESLKATYAGDPDAYAAYVDGRWVQTSKDSLFPGVFSLGRHVVGLDGDEEMVPEDECVELCTGWDPGERNKAAHIHEKVVRGNDIIWKTLDELVVIDQELPIEEFAILFLEKMDEWEEICGKKFRWIHWADSAATSSKSSGILDSMRIAKATEGRIQIQGAPKYDGSVPERVKIAKHLLIGNRWLINARCEALINSLKGGLKRDSSKKSYLRNNRHKHPFDSATYPILSESAWDLQLGSFMPKSTDGRSSIFSAKF